MRTLIRTVAVGIVLACAGCVFDPGFYGGGPSYPYPGDGYPTYPSYPDYPGSDYGGAFRCESRDNRTQRCPTDIRGGVRLLRQLSNTPCVKGQTWDVDRSGVWVTRGCRAEFIAGYGGASSGQGSGLVRCESQDMRTRHCPANTRGGVRLVRQLSSTRCIEGSTWGYDRDGIWVSQGCRAEFAAGRGGDGHRPEPGYGQIIRCESRDGRQRRCNVYIEQHATLVRQLSSSPCIRGTSWGWDRDGIWVGSGCRAEFSVR